MYVIKVANQYGLINQGTVQIPPKLILQQEADLFTLYGV